MHEKVLWILKRAGNENNYFKKRKNWSCACILCVIICYKYLTDKKYRKVRDHCHDTGDCRDAAHSIFNLKYSVPRKFL